MPLLYEETESIFAQDKYKEAVAEAARIAEEKGIQMTVESLEPVHLGLSEYKLPVGDNYVALRENIVVYPYGVFSNDPNFVEIEWWAGAKTEMLFSWLTKFVYHTIEKSATMPIQPTFKGDFTFTVETETPATTVDAWILAYVVLPATAKGQSIKR